MEEVFSTLIPRAIKEVKELLCIDNEDVVIQIMRFYDWNLTKVQEEWFEKEDELKYKIGLEFDPRIPTKHPSVNETRKENNQNSCGICFMDFEDEDEDY